ncbi:hypothetical protein BJ322DRAFT_1063545 [Thelephora terrestris]|uniref:Uncharacterized protein n=1 Tax=Thelephora terrestris TaxID=56493 RepID=A0A9P6L0K2_9AGAM|nr:hypothetical protein BJ322DRAFT_1096838 [Thelephora terrestris]KAF9785513.1 hypothetical protein BJ322DRAFT_1063545 [Thelephora terrestris]
MSAYFSTTAYPTYQQFSPSANLSGYPSIIAGADYVDPHTPSPASATFTLSDLFSQQSTLPDSPFQYTSAYSQLSGSEYTPSPPNTGYLAPQTLLQRQPRPTTGRHTWGVRPDPNPMPCALENDPIPSIRRASLPPSRLATGLPSPSLDADFPLSAHSDGSFSTARFGIANLDRDKGCGSSSSTPTPSPTPSPTSATFSPSSFHPSIRSEVSSDSGRRSPSQSKHTDSRRRRADRRRSKLLEIASVLPFRATDPDEMSSHDKRRCYVGTLEEYVIWLEKEMKVFGGVPISMKKVAKSKGMSCRSLRTMLAHFQDEAHKLHEQVQAQEREALELQALLDEEEHRDQQAGLGSTLSAPSCAPISGPFTTVPIHPQPPYRPLISASHLQGYEY